MLRIALTGHSGARNRGCEAIVRTTVEIINRRIQDPEIILISFDPASDRSALKSDIKNLSIPDVVTTYPKKHSLKWIVNGIYRKFLPGNPNYITFANQKFYRNTDVIISIGGDNFTDDYEEGPSRFFRELMFAKSLGKMTIIWGASIGPFHNPLLEKRWAQQLRKMDLITVRENESLSYLEQIDVKDNVKLVADPAFLLAADHKEVIPLAKQKKGRFVGFGISSLISSYGSSQRSYLKEFVSFGKYLLSDNNTKLILIPHVFGPTTLCNDEVICRQLAEELHNDDRVILINSKYNACQIKYVISQCDYFIGARTHSTIASLSELIPTISLAYSSKAYGINKDIFGHLNYIIPIDELDRMILIEKFKQLCQDRIQIIEHLKKRIPALKNLADRAGDYLVDRIINKGYDTTTFSKKNGEERFI